MVDGWMNTHTDKETEKEKHPQKYTTRCQCSL